MGRMINYQYARTGLSTADALISFLQPIFEAIDNGDNIARIFFTDFSKGFDHIGHNILMGNLQKLNIYHALMNWVSAFFLTECKQSQLPEYCLIGNIRMAEFCKEQNWV
jgi:hypothetical protein